MIAFIASMKSLQCASVTFLEVTTLIDPFLNCEIPIL